MSYMDLLPASTPSTAEERIRSIIANGHQFTEYETLPNGDVLGAVRAPLGPRARATMGPRSPEWTDWMDVLVPRDGSKARVLA